MRKGEERNAVGDTARRQGAKDAEKEGTFFARPLRLRAFAVNGLPDRRAKG
jgi:hypothetical protein